MQGWHIADRGWQEILVIKLPGEDNAAVAPDPVIISDHRQFR